MTEKYAIVSLTDPSDHPRIYHTFLYLYDLKENGVDAELFLDGASAKIIDELEKNPNDIIIPLYDKAVRDGLIKQACGFCANAFKVKDKILETKIQMTAEDGHIELVSSLKMGIEL
ncbi:hypothetical protein [Candidatus Nitrosotenuis uzonensis]|uniref:DsrE family protein n=1 Tax=Candidatus Nitrosotenuis uzonensis TaxID=1407055 RepID=A0A812F9A8_9ARCH|nr:hypothetical protein [Candidatus Nitrosotenuis uzonensis]CAE6501050.1 conserved hypothetical protein [Candidatus Nitrosotenuis uzonensis]